MTLAVNFGHEKKVKLQLNKDVRDWDVERRRIFTTSLEIKKQCIYAKTKK